MSKKLEDFMMNVFPWRTITVCLMIICAAAVIQCSIMVMT